LGVNVAIFGLSFSFYLKESNKEAYQMLVFAVIFTLFDLLVAKFIDSERD
jgi:hypothetical protein